MSVNPATYYRVHGVQLLKVLEARDEALSDRDLWRSRAEALGRKVEALERRGRVEDLPTVRLRGDERGFEEA